MSREASREKRILRDGLTSSRFDIQRCADRIFAKRVSARVRAMYASQTSFRRIDIYIYIYISCLHADVPRRRGTQYRLYTFASFVPIYYVC